MQPVNLIKTMWRALALLLVAGAAFGQQYRWIDESGRIHYSDTPPPASAKKVEQKHFRDNAVGPQPHHGLAQATAKSPVTLYTHPTCKQPCDLARDLLKARAVPFREISAVEKPTQDELKRISGDVRVPVMVVGARVEAILSADSYNAALTAAGYPAAGAAVPPGNGLPKPQGY